MTRPTVYGASARLRHSLVAALATSILLAACSSTGATPTSAGPTTPTGPTSTSTSSAATPAPTSDPATPAPSPVTSIPAETPGPTEEASATAEPAPSLSGDLASLMPTEIAGQTMTIEPASDSAESFLILWNDEQLAQDLLDNLGRTTDDVDIVFAYAGDAEFPEQLLINAYRVAGADGDALLQGMVDNYLQFLPGFEAIPETIGGNEVTALGLAAPPPGAVPQYFYAVGDIVFTVEGNPPEWVEEALTQLP